MDCKGKTSLLNTNYFFEVMFVRTKAILVFDL
jgi:hypothetical protein